MEKTLEIQLHDLRESIAQDIEAAMQNYVDSTPVEDRQESFLCGLGVYVTSISIARGIL
jgi:hypothetical protein